MTTMTEQDFMQYLADGYRRQSGAWTLEVESWAYGMVPTVGMVATRKCGRVERFQVSRWMSGWRILRLGLDIPATVRRDAIRVGKEVWPDES